MLARCQLQLGRAPDALVVIDAVLAAAPDRLDAIELRAQILDAVGRTDTRRRRVQRLAKRG